MKTILTTLFIFITLLSFSQNFIGNNKDQIINYLIKEGEAPQIKNTKDGQNIVSITEYSVNTFFLYNEICIGFCYVYRLKDLKETIDNLSLLYEKQTGLNWIQQSDGFKTHWHIEINGDYFTLMAKPVFK